MSEDDVRLREMARNHGFRLVKSRRRKAGGDHGRYGLVDAAHEKHCFGFGKDGLTATAEEVEDYLRERTQDEWKRSLTGRGSRAR
jgi:hypothetical protein